MPTRSRRTARLAGTLIAVSALALGAVGCSSNSPDNANDDVSSSKPCGTAKDTTLTVGLFGTFGFKENGLYDEYKKVCPNITVKEDVVEQSADYWTRLKTRLASGSGLADVQAIEIGFVADVVENHADQFVNFNDVSGADEVKAPVLRLEVEAGQQPGRQDHGRPRHRHRPGGHLLPLRPDRGCRLQRRPGRPREQVGHLGRLHRLRQGLQGEDRQGVRGQQRQHLLHRGLPGRAGLQRRRRRTRTSRTATACRAPGSYATQAAEAGITAGLSQFSDPWNKAFSSGSFAAIACPTWMMGYIQGQAGPDYAGKWAVAPVLPGGATNWGGSWLGVPTAAKNKAAAIALVKWLSDKDQQVTMWTSAKQGGHFPSNQQAAEDPAVASAKSAYFSDAPVGQIFGDIAGKMSIPPIGLYDTQIQNALTTQLTNVETKGTSPDKAFDDALAAIEQITG